MKSRPRIGTAGEQSFVVEEKHAIEFHGGGMPAVLSTPALIGQLERTARLFLQPHLEEGESTVGQRVDIEHLAPTAIGQRVSCLARVMQIDGSVISFQLEARDEANVIARGYHRRRVIRIARFAARVAGKSGR